MTRPPLRLRFRHIHVARVVSLRRGRLLEPGARTSVRWVSTVVANVVGPRVGCFGADRRRWSMQCVRVGGFVRVQLHGFWWTDEGLHTESYIMPWGGPRPH